MKTLVPAPPRPRSINWYRVGAWGLLVIFVCFLAYSAIFAWPSMWGEAPPAVLLGSVILGGAVELIGTMTFMGLLMALFWLAIWLLWKLLIGLFIFGEWWHNKMQEADKRNLTYED